MISAIAQQIILEKYSGIQEEGSEFAIQIPISTRCKPDNLKVTS